MNSRSNIFQGVVTSKDEVLRLDRAIVEILDIEISRNVAARLIREGRAKVDGEVVTKPSVMPKKGQTIVLEVPRPSVPEKGSLLEPRVLFEDEYFAILDKPAGLLMHPNTQYGTDPSVASWLESRQATSLPTGQGDERPGIVHRLDRGTSGVCLVAFEKDSFDNLLAQFAERKIRKEYRAVVYGKPRFVSNRIEKRLTSDAKHPGRVCVTDSTRIGTRDAVSDYEVLETFDNFAYLRVEPRTGRKHQIRVHLASEELPILGDPFYRVGKFHPALLPRHCLCPDRPLLHAYSISFQHPFTGEGMSYCVEEPDDMVEIRQFLSRSTSALEGGDSV